MNLLKFLIFINKYIIMKPTKEQIFGIIRHGLTFIGGVLVMNGLINEGMSQELIGGLMTFIGTIWSVFDKKK